MQRKIIVITLITLAMIVLSGCFIQSCNSSNSNEPMPGSDRDAHGCIPSAGYSWCEAKQKCLRVWEEPCS